MFKNLLLIGLAASVSFSATAQKKKDKKKKSETEEAAPAVVATPPTPAAAPVAEKPYRAMYTRKMDLLHTKLDVRFNWDSAFVMGKATLTLKPWFYPQNTVVLNAKGFTINQVALVKGKTNMPLKYEYDGKLLTIKLDKEYTRFQEVQVFIDYVGMPDKLKSGGSAAISNDKGLYFINKDGKVADKPRQIWTQGETEANSCWMPTIDGPQEKHTQELFITVPKEYVTLSNGLMQYSTENADGTRTDVWKQTLPHATYLTMMAVGKYAVVKDKWRDMEVSYYVEPEYEQYARSIFGKTPQMIEFFSTRLGVDYPWDKYGQVVARDYVSGAMENTSATLFGEFMQVDDREALDVGDSNEDVVSHELFHQWFGDLVTCESWANLPLNESFATYGEYLWEEHAYGREFADFSIQADMNAYLQGGKGSMKTLFRPDYEDKEDMFDLFSYQKGGRVLHMLRKYVGDDAFFTSLQLYLDKNKFNNAEIMDLRMAFEQVTGEDLNWFFNQWFTKPGTPDLEISYSWDAAAKKAGVTIQQKQDLGIMPLYRLPLDVAIYEGGKKRTERIWVTAQSETFNFDCAIQPDAINVDAEKQLLGTKKDNHTAKEWAFLFYNGGLYLDRYEAVEALEQFKDTEEAQKVVADGLNDKFWNIRSFALSKVKNLSAANKEAAYQRIVTMAKSDERAAVRTKAMNTLSAEYGDKDQLAIFKAGLNDQAYSTVAASLRALDKINNTEAMTLAKGMESMKSAFVRAAIAELYAKNGTAAENEFYLNAVAKTGGFGVLGVISSYKTYLMRMDEATVKVGVEAMRAKYANSSKYAKNAIKVALNSIASSYEDKSPEMKKYVDSVIDSLT